MFDGQPTPPAQTSPDLDLLLAPGDEAAYLGEHDWRDRAGQTRRCRLYLALHRRQGSSEGAWTHLYRVLPDRRPGHLTVYLERALPGDERAALRDWALAACGAHGG